MDSNAQQKQTDDQKQANQQPSEPAIPAVTPLQNTASPAAVKTMAGKQVQQPTAVVSQSSTPPPVQSEVQPPAPIPAPAEIPQASVVAPQPVSAPRSKEQEPVSAPLPDVAKMSEAEIVAEEKEVEKELESYVEKSPDTEKPDIPKDVQQAGVVHTGEDVPIQATTSGAVSMPMSYDEAEFTRKKYKWKSSVAWLAAVVMYHWKKIKINSKEEKIKE